MITENTDIIYYITDLTGSSRRKNILINESKKGLINFISEKYKKPIFRIFIKDTEKKLLEDKMNNFKFYSYNNEMNFKMGDFLLQLEEAGEL